MPFTDLPFLKSIKITAMTDNDIEPLASYLKSKAIHKPLSFQYTPDLIVNRLKSWPGFHKENFLIARDIRGRIVGCVAPWKASNISSINVLNYSGFGETLYSFSRFFSLFKFIKRLPPVGGTIPVKFLTHFYADNPDIFASLLAEVFRITGRDEILTYTHFRKTPLTMPPRNFFFSRIPFSIYTVLPADRTLPEFLHVHKVSPPPELEPVMI